MRMKFFMIVSMLLVMSMPAKMSEEEADYFKYYSKQKKEQVCMKQTLRSEVADENERLASILDKAVEENAQLFNDSSMDRLYNIAKKHDIKPSWIILVMVKESNIDPRAINSTSNAVGIIQFMPKTARYLGTSTRELYNMSLYQQLKYVDKYIELLDKSHLINSYEDLHLAVFYPRALGRDPGYVIGKKGSKVVKYNRSIANGRDYITVKRFKTWSRT